MIKDYQTFKELSDTASSYLRSLFYSNKIVDQYGEEWRRINRFMKERGIPFYTLEVGEQYLLETVGDIEILKLTRHQRNRVRKTTSLSDFLITGKMKKRKFREMPRDLDGQIGIVMSDYIINKRKINNWSSSTAQSCNLYLSRILEYLEESNVLSIEEFDNDTIIRFVDYLHEKSYSVITRHLIILTAARFLKYLFENGKLKTDLSKVISNDKYVHLPKLPSFFSKEEIEQLLSSIERTNPNGRRNYAMVLLVARLGIRCSDVASLKFENLLWEKQTIFLIQQKTKETLELPLFGEIGESIIDYLKHGRPVSDLPYIFLRHIPPYDRMDNNALNGIMQKYMRLSGIKYDERHHGPHALRHSLATRLLQGNTPLPIISGILGHKRTESTMFYLRVDSDSLSRCALDVPPLPERKEDVR